MNTVLSDQIRERLVLLIFTGPFSRMWIQDHTRKFGAIYKFG